MSFEDVLQAIIDKAVREAAAAVRADVTQRLLGDRRGTPAARRTAPSSPAKRGRVAGKPKPKAATRHYPKICPVQGCGKPSAGGPRFSFCCTEHMALPAAKRKAALKAAKSQTE